MNPLPENADLQQIAAKVNEVVNWINECEGKVGPMAPEPEDTVDALDSQADNPESEDK